MIAASRRPIFLAAPCLPGWRRLVEASVHLLALTRELGRNPLAHEVEADVLDEAYAVAAALEMIATDPALDALGAPQAHLDAVLRVEMRRPPRRQAVTHAASLGSFGWLPAAEALPRPPRRSHPKARGRA